MKWFLYLLSGGEHLKMSQYLQHHHQILKTEYNEANNETRKVIVYAKWPIPELGNVL